MSSVIRSINYNEDTRITTVVFVSGKSYDYNSIPYEIVKEWKNASSLGSYFNQNIKGVFE